MKAFTLEDRPTSIANVGKAAMAGVFIAVFVVFAARPLVKWSSDYQVQHNRQLDRQLDHEMSQLPPGDVEGLGRLADKHNDERYWYADSSTL